MRCQRLIEATNSILQLKEFVDSTFACWEKIVPFGSYNFTKAGEVTTRQVVAHTVFSCLCNKDDVFFKSESEFINIATKTPRSNCVLNSRKFTSVGIKVTEVNEAIERDHKRWQNNE